MIDATLDRERSLLIVRPETAWAASAD